MENHQLSSDNPMILEIRELLEKSRKNIAQQVNTELLTTYWNIGRIIVEYEQQSQLRAEYGKQTLKELSKELTREFGKGFSRSNLQNMRAFYLAYEKCQTPSGKLAWSHYCELLTISDEDKRSFYVLGGDSTLYIVTLGSEWKNSRLAVHHLGSTSRTAAQSWFLP